jgi:hypothetical protein
MGRALNGYGRREPDIDSKHPMKEKTMASDEQHEDVTEKVDDTVIEGEATPAVDAPTGFPDRWGGGADDTQHSGEGFAEKWSGDPDAPTEKQEEFGEHWSGEPVDSPERTEGFGATWSGENQEQPKT